MHSEAVVAPSGSRPLLISSINVGNRSRLLNPQHVEQLKNSFARLGGQLQLQPVVVDEHLTLIDGAHRLEAARQSGWSHILAQTLTGSSALHLPLLEHEANLVRRGLGPAHLEAAWRKHYEPELRARAKQRQLSGLRRGSTPATDASTAARPHPRSIAESAKAVTGLSLATLNKVAEIRSLAALASASARVRETAAAAMRKLEEPGAAVSPLHRSVLAELSREHTSSEQARPVGDSSAQRELEQAFQEVSALMQKLRGRTGEALRRAQPDDDQARDMLRALRVSLMSALTEVTHIEQQRAETVGVKVAGHEASSRQVRRLVPAGSPLARVSPRVQRAHGS